MSWRIISGCLTFIGLVAVLAFAAIIIGYYTISLTPPIREEMAPVALSAEAVKSLNNKLESFHNEIQQASNAGLEKEVMLVVTEEEVNSKLTELLAEDTSPIKEVLINFRQDIMLRYWLIDTPILGTKLALKTALEAKGGKIQRIADEVNLGALPLPNIVERGAAEILNWSGQILAGILPTDTNWQITSVKIGDGQISIKGTTQRMSRTGTPFPTPKP